MEVAALIGLLLIVVLITGGSLLYFIPSIIAIARNHPNMASIIVVNLLLGWSFVGWVISLAWSLTNETRRY